MSTYAIGDIQGCYRPLQRLLKKIAFNPQHDNLWFAGDLVNRGPQSLETLRFIQSLDTKQITVLGNHDLHFLAVYYGVRALQRTDTLEELLNAPDCANLVNWLLRQHLFYYDAKLNIGLCHAGLAPNWTVAEASSLANEVTAQLQSNDVEKFLAKAFGNTPNNWHPNLSGIKRLRTILNYFTRTRYLNADGSLNFSQKQLANSDNFIPWYAYSNRQSFTTEIIFGHWAALKGEVNGHYNVQALDTGCAWGGELTAIRLEDKMRFAVNCT